jgi:hypothetical protein
MLRVLMNWVLLAGKAVSLATGALKVGTPPAMDTLAVGANVPKPAVVP